MWMQWTCCIEGRSYVSYIAECTGENVIIVVLSDISCLLSLSLSHYFIFTYFLASSLSSQCMHVYVYTDVFKGVKA